MERNQQQKDNNTGRAERDNPCDRDENSAVSNNASSDINFSPNLNYVSLDMTSQPFLYFHDNILKNYMRTSPIDKRIAAIHTAKAKLIEELNNIYALQDQVDDLLARFQQHKKS